MQKLIGVLVLLAALACAVAARAAEGMVGADSRWQRYQSKNFELYSDGAEPASRELLHSLELVRALFQDRMKAVERARLDVTVYLFRSRQEFRAYMPEHLKQGAEFAAYYSGFPDRAVIVVSPVEDWDSVQHVVFHEYVHHLFRVSELEPTLWFNEGMAELLAGIRMDGDFVEIGHPHLGRIAALLDQPLMPLENLFGVDYQSPIYHSDEHTGIFYAESWALLHYWYCGDSKIPIDATKRFLHVAGDAKLARTTNLRSYFQDCFGMSYRDMERRLETYVSNNSTYRYSRQPMPPLEAEKSYPKRGVEKDEISARLAELALRVNRSAAAKIVLRDFAEKNPSDPRPFEALGAEAIADGDEVAAKERWEAALAAGSRNVAVYRELALRESHAWFDGFDFYFRLPADATARLRNRLRQSVDLEPVQSAPYEMLAWVEAFADRPDIPNINLIQGHFGILKQKARTALALAMVRLRFNKPEDARDILDKLDDLEPDSWTAHAAGVVREHLPPAEAPRPGARAKASAPTPAETQAARPPLKRPSVELPDVR